MIKKHTKYDWNEINNYLDHISLPARWVSELVKMKDDITSDCVSKCQLMSKFHTIEMLTRGSMSHLNRCAIVGAWYGQWAQILYQSNIARSFTGIDIDPSCKGIAERLNSNLSYDHITQDMYEFDYTGYDLIINTSCEHIPDTKEWIKLLPKNKIVVLHSNNYYDVHDHINCTENIEAFVADVELAFDRIYKAETLDLPMYERHIIIGYT